jgi:hypothetical protein
VAWLNVPTTNGLLAVGQWQHHSHSIHTSDSE